MRATVVPVLAALALAQTAAAAPPVTVTGPGAGVFTFAVQPGAVGCTACSVLWRSDSPAAVAWTVKGSRPLAPGLFRPTLDAGPVVVFGALPAGRYTITLTATLRSPAWDGKAKAMLPAGTSATATWQATVGRKTTSSAAPSARPRTTPLPGESPASGEPLGFAGGTITGD